MRQWRKAKGDIHHDLAVEIISLLNLEEIILVQYTLKFIEKVFINPCIQKDGTSLKEKWLG